MKMVKHMALPFVTICALVSVTVMAYEANYAGNPVTVTNGWDSRQYIATSILRIDSDSVGANVGAGIEVTQEMNEIEEAEKVPSRKSLKAEAKRDYWIR